MTPRKIKTREQILRTIRNLRRDLYFSFGVPYGTDGLYGPEMDDRVHVDVSRRETISWLTAVAKAGDDFEGTVFCPKGVPQPKLPSATASARSPKPPSPDIR
jgi:hypothetical protein